MPQTNFSKDTNYKLLLKKKIDNLKSPITIRIEFVVKKNFQSDGFTDKFYQTLKEETIPTIPVPRTFGTW